MLLIDHIVNLLLAGLILLVATMSGRRLCRWTGWLLPTLLGRAVVAASLGLAALSLSVFIVGLIGLLYLWAVMAVMGGLALIGAPEIPRAWGHVRRWNTLARPNLVVTALIGVVVIEAIFILVVNLAPPSGADPQLYHLSLPKYYIDRHQIEWLPHFPGASPQLVETLYTAGMLLRGDVLAAQLNAVLLFLAVAALWMLARRYSGSAAVAWLAAALFFTLPGVFNLGISVKVEAALVLYSLLAWYFLLLWLDEGKHRWLVLLAVCAGLLLNTKYQGFFVFAGLTVAGLAGVWMRRAVVLRDRRQLYRAALLGCVVILVLLLPWYGRNWWHGGDPFWPLGYPLFTSRFYTVEAYERFASWNIGLGTSPLQLITGPWNLTMNTAAFGSRDFRTMLSPIFLALVPMLPLAWRYLGREQRRLSVLLLMAVGVVYLIWFYSGYQKLDYLFPVLALTVIVIALTSETLLRNGSWLLRGLIVGSLVITISAQLVLSAARARLFVPVVIGTVSEQQYLRQTVSNYDDMKWANTNLPADARILSLSLHPYFFDRPYTYGAAAYSGVIDYPGLDGVADFLGRLESLEITHIAIPEKDIASYLAGLSQRLWPQANLEAMGEDLIAKGHLVEVYHNPSARIVTSRTFGWNITGDYWIYQVMYNPSGIYGSSIYQP